MLLEKSDEKFIRNIYVMPEKIVSLMNDRQLNDIKRFCSSNKAISILGVDPAYNIGQCFVMITTFLGVIQRKMFVSHFLIFSPPPFTFYVTFIWKITFKINSKINSSEILKKMKFWLTFSGKNLAIILRKDC